MNNIKVIDFYKKRYIYFAISIAIILTGIIFACVNGIKLDITFQGGSILKYSYVGNIKSEEAGALVQKAINKEATCQEQTIVGTNQQILTVNLAGNNAILPEEQQTIETTLQNAYPNSNITLSNSLSVQPFTGARFFRNGIIAIVLSFVLILLYVAIRFTKIGGFSAGVMGIIALFHDAFVVTAVFFVFQIPLNDSFVASILTVIGFSINDTIVIYDRIRENKALLGPKVSTEELVDLSITQSLVRSINTTATVFVCILIVYIFSVIYNIETIKNFALPMLFGVVTGCYSTICIAGPLWTMWKNHQAKKANLKKA